jgi:hypothetical protein
MKLREYLDLIKKRPFTWAREHGLEKNGVYKALAGSDLRLKTALKICEASKGAVRPEDLA